MSGYHTCPRCGNLCNCKSTACIHSCQQIITSYCSDCIVKDAEIKALRDALEAVRTYLEERHIREKGTTGRTVILPMIDAVLGKEATK